MLRGKDSAEILRKICDGDPLGLVERTLERLESRALLLDFKRVMLRAAARAAFRARFFNGRADIGPWLDDRIDEATRDMMNEDSNAEFQGMPVLDPPELRFMLVSQLLGIELGLARKACMTFNALPGVERKAVWAVMVQEKNIIDYSIETGDAPEEIKEHIASAFASLNKLTDPIPLPPDRRRRKR